MVAAVSTRRALQHVRSLGVLTRRAQHMGALIGWLALVATLAGCDGALAAQPPAQPPAPPAAAAASIARTTPVPATATPAPKPARALPCTAPAAPAHVFAASELRHPFLMTNDAF